MSEIKQVEQKLLGELKKKIEVMSGLGDSSGWTQKDYEYLIYFVESKTGIKLSLSTIKRIWRNQYDRLPHSSTLDALAQLCFKTDWLPLKKEHLEKEITVADSNQSFTKRHKKVVLTLFTIVVCSVLVFLYLRFLNNKSVSYDEEKIKFSCKKSADGKIPNTVIFSYDVKEVEADEFFIQQSWDKARRVKISKNNTKQTDIYYTPGFFNAKLIANNKVIKEIPVHVVYDDWYVAAIQKDAEIKPLKKDSWTKENYLGINEKSLRANNIDLEEHFWLNYYNVRDFDIDGDNFAYSSSFKMDSLSSVICPNMNLYIKGEHTRFKINFGNKGCESNLQTLCSDLKYSGKTSDLSMFGCDIYEWQELSVNVNNKTLDISLNNTEIFKCTYNKPIGTIKAITHSFSGVGYIDNVQLQHTDGKEEFYDDFHLNTF